MGQFMVYANSNKQSNKTYPYLIDIQSNLLEDLKSTVVIPLMAVSGSGEVITKLCPTFNISGKKFVALTPQLSGIDKTNLGKQVVDLTAHRHDLVAAIDFLISGV